MSPDSENSLYAIQRWLRLAWSLGLLMLVLAFALSCNLFFLWIEIQAPVAYVLMGLLGFTGTLLLFMALKLIGHLRQEIIIPLNLLSRTAEQILYRQISDFQPLPKHKDEITHFVQRFNALLQQIAANEKLVAKKVELATHTAEKAEHMIFQLKQKNEQPSLFQVLPLCLIVIDQHFNIIDINQRALTFYQISKAQAQGRPIGEISSWPPIDEQKLYLAIENQTPQHLGQYEQCDNHQASVTTLMAYPMQWKHRQAIVIYLEDITQQVQNEACEAQADKMSSMRGLVAGMSHELNNPLGGILQNAQNIKRRVDPVLAKNQQVAKACGVSIESIHDYFEKRELIKFLDAIQQYGQRAAEIVGHLLQFSGHKEKHKEQTDIHALIQRAVQLTMNDKHLKDMLQTDEVAVDYQFQEKSVTLACHVAEIEQVLFNIIKNALQAMHQKKQSQGDGYQPKLQFKTKTEGNYFVIEINDNGPGMTKEVLKRVFEPFYTTRDIGQGTGLGMAVSYFLVTANHQGQIQAESTPGDGCWFKVFLPLFS